MSEDQIKDLHEHEIKNQGTYPNFVISNIYKALFPADNQAPYWREVAVLIFPEEIAWMGGEYHRRPELVEIVKGWKWAEEFPWAADLLACWHEFDWEVKRTVMSPVLNLEPSEARRIDAFSEHQKQKETK